MGSLARLGSGALSGLLQPCMAACVPAAHSLAAFGHVRHFAAAADDPSITVEVSFAFAPQSSLGAIAVSDASAMLSA